MTKTMTRRRGPYTSTLAAKQAAPKAPISRLRVHAILQDAGPEGLTHEQIISQHRTREATEGWPPVSQSRVRTACHELVELGMVERVPDAVGRSRAGNRSLLWRATGVR